MPESTPSPLGARLPHDSALRHVSGEALYVDDLPVPDTTLHAMVLPSAWAHARITALRTGDALQVPGVHAVFTAADIPGHNNVGPVFHDEPVLADGVVHCKGQPIAVVYAESREACRAALARIQVEVEPLPAILDIEAAIAADSFHGEPHVVARGDAAAAIDQSPHVLEGTVSNGGQEHFYLESHCALATPGEDRTLHVLSSTQHPSEVQALVAEALGWGRHRVVVECPRMGGAFGGKETQAAQFGVLAALGVYHTGRPVKCWLDRDTDMQITGRRHPFRTHYRVGFDDRGAIEGIELQLFSEGGWAADLSLAIVDRAVFHVDNAYWLPQVRITAKVCKTNKTSNTAFRGFGGPQGMAVIENVMDAIADHLQADPLAVRRLNLYGGPGRDRTPYGQHVDDFRIARMFDELEATASLTERRAEVEAFNLRHTHRKRALAMTPVKFGISFTASFLNQAGAYLVLYADGTAQLNHGGTEMGQGLYTKMLVVCAHALGVPLDRIRHMHTSTDKVPNTSATAASSGADLNGQAVRHAALQLVERLRPVAAELLGVSEGEVTLASESDAAPTKGAERAWAWAGDASVTLAEVAGAAYLRQIPMAAAGFYATPDIAYDRAKGQGKPFHYFAYGVGLSEVELDGLTGEWQLRRVDILHDVGDSLSHDIDVGQVEGAYVQGLGWLTTEELVFDDQGGLLSHSPSTYKIPAIGDVPRALHVHLLSRATQPDVVYGSKAVGEPPFNLAIGTHLALRRAASAFGAPVQLPMPATTEALLFAVEEARQGASEAMRAASK
jgi:xanthine dehydrogenase large subunit